MRHIEQPYRGVMTRADAAQKIALAIGPTTYHTAAAYGCKLSAVFSSSGKNPAK